MREVNFKTKLGLFGQRIERERILLHDLWRFVLLTVIILLLGFVFRLEKTQIFDVNEFGIQITKRVDQGSYLEIKNEGQYFSLFKTDSKWDYVVKSFPEIAYEPFVGLGNLDEIKGGYFGDFDFKTFETFLPKSYRDPLFFAKGDCVLLIEPVDYTDEKAEPEIVKERLIYDEVYPGILVIRMFNSLGIKDYFLVKDDVSVKNISFRLNYNGGEVVAEPNGSVVFYDDNNEAKFVISKLIGLDASGRRIDDFLKYQLDGDRLNLVMDFDSNEVDYPVIIDPVVIDGGGYD